MLARDRNLKGYSRLRKADLINLLRLNVRVSPNSNRVPEIAEPIEQPMKQPLNTLTKHQFKHRRNKASKLSKKARSLRIEIDDLKSQMDDIEYKVAKASSSTSSMFKRKKIRSMKREATKIAEKIKEQTEKLDSPESKQPIQQAPKTNKRIKNKIADLNRTIRRAKCKTKRNLIAKRDALKLQQFDVKPKIIEGAFGGSYSRYRINGVEGMDLPTFFSETRDSVLSLLRGESVRGAIRSQTTTWIRFMKDNVEYVDLAFNSKMTPVYNLNDIDNIVRSMIDHMAQQVENPALRDSKFVFDRVMQMDINIHRLNLTRGSSYIPLPDWLSRKEAIINPKNLDMKCFKWAVIAALKWREIEGNVQRISKLRWHDDLDWDGINFPVST